MNDNKFGSENVRTELTNFLSRDLLGPWDGPDESIVGTPRGRYLVGSLAPISIDENISQSEASEAEGISEDVLIADLSQSKDVKGVPADEEDLDADVAGQDDEEDRGPVSKIIAPSSMGLRFQVSSETNQLRFTARWGQYSSRKDEDENGKERTYFDRTPYEESRVVDLSSIKPGISVRNELVEDHVEIAIEVFEHDGKRVVEAALLNVKVTGKELPPRLWLFQSELEVTSVDGQPVFLPTRDVLLEDRDHRDPEVRQLDLLYRDKLEFAVGRTSSATWTIDEPDSRIATSVRTTWLPTAQIPQTRAPEVPGVVLSMQKLETADIPALKTGLSPLIDAYQVWLGDQADAAKKLPKHLQAEAFSGVSDGEQALKRLRLGLDLLLAPENGEARKAFSFMNRTMREQRIRTQISSLRMSDKSISIDEAENAIAAKGDKAASWRAFQLAFILMQLPSVVDPTIPRRSSDLPRAELLFFPTGGGKTEAYLGLAAFTFGMRRLQGIVETPEGVLDGNDGVTVLMRYTLRLLTSQQFLRATTLMCAAELARMEDPGTWGQSPFRIGLWVGSSVSPKNYVDAAKQVRDVREQDGNSAFGLTALQFSHCPWCGTAINPRKHVEAFDAESRIRVFCGSLTGCPFAAGGSAVEGLPVLTVDDEIYRHPPTFLLATVDKFARLAREGEAASLFGYVSHKCPRHGYRHPDSSVCTTSNHNAVTKNGKQYPAVVVTPVDRLRPPDLIIQDELHLITGALGTAVGLFEGAVDVLSTWQLGVDEESSSTVKPLIVASTATVRKASEQVRRLYARQVEVFPPQVLSVSDTFFSEEVPITQEDPGRLYLGVCAHGARLTLAEIRVSEILLQAGQKLFDEYGEAAEPYMTLVDYFSATRELAGMRRYLEDDVTTRISNPDKSSGYPRRGTNGLRIGELTSRISSSEIAQTLTGLAVPFDPEKDTTTGKIEVGKQIELAIIEGKKLPARDWAYDVVLATSMLQVGVDVPRLGLMLIVGQPKNTAEYIQASSRVGREASKPGLVVALSNRSRPRDMAHYEQFENYHDTFYANVEALSVTPFSDASMERGLTGLIVSAARVADAPDGTASLSPETSLGAGKIVARRAIVDSLVSKLTDRISQAAAEDGQEAAHNATSKIILRVDKWIEQADLTNGGLTYHRKSLPQQIVTPLLSSPEDEIGDEGSKLFQVANSMREVQPEIDLLVSPLQLAEPKSSVATKWTFPEKKKKVVE